MKRLDDINDAFDVLGGSREIAEQTGDNQSTVCNWRARGRFPRKRYPVIMQMIARAGYEAGPALWGLR